MAKTEKELDALKKEVRSVCEQCAELTPEELEQVTGGTVGQDLLGPIAVAAYSYMALVPIIQPPLN